MTTEFISSLKAILLAVFAVTLLSFATVTCGGGDDNNDAPAAAAADDTADDDDDDMTAMTCEDYLANFDCANSIVACETGADGAATLGADVETVSYVAEVLSFATDGERVDDAMVRVYGAPICGVSDGAGAITLEVPVTANGLLDFVITADRAFDTYDFQKEMPGDSELNSISETIGLALAALVGQEKPETTAAIAGRLEGPADVSNIGVSIDGISAAACADQNTSETTICYGGEDDTPDSSLTLSSSSGIYVFFNVPPMAAVGAPGPENRAYTMSVSAGTATRNGVDAYQGAISVANILIQ